jgi:uncharacterized RDD family membrane protein YckC
MKKTIPLLLAIALASLAAATEAPAPGAAPAVAAPAAAAPTAAAPAAPAAAAPAVAAAAKAKPAASADGKHGIKIEIKAGSDDEDAGADEAAAADADQKEEHVDSVVSIGHDSTLEAGKRAEAVVSVFGSSTSDGDVDGSVVSVFGNTRATGKVGESAVSVFGNTYIDGHVGESVVATLGNVELGPHAVVDGDVVAVGGDLVRDPGAVVHGGVQNVMIFGHMGNMEWLHNWVHRCLMLGRPLAIAPGLGWAWAIAFSFLVLYLVLALLFPAGITRCVQTMEAQPGRTALAALLTFIGKPILFVLLLITVIGSFLVPFLAFALMIAGLFGKAVAFAWLGRRALPKRESGSEFPPVLAVLVGGLIAFVLYIVPVLGFIAYKGLDVLGLGMVVYTLILAHRARREAAQAAQAELAGATASPQAEAAAATPGAATGAADAGSATTAGAAAAPAAEPAPAPAPAPAPTLSLALENRAGFWIRTLALLLDVFLVAIVASIVGIHVHDALLLIIATYGAVMWRLRGTTIGGIVCGLRVVRLDGRPIDWPTAVTRALGSFLSLFVAGLGFIWVVFDAERQSWHDKIAGTVIVHAPRGTPLV